MTEVELTISGRAPEPSGARLVLTLALAGMLSGFALAGVFQVTKPVIDANRARELREAVFKVVPGSTRLQPLAVRDGGAVPVAEPAPGDEVVYAAHAEDGRFMGFAITGSGAGFQDTISLLYGFDPAGGQVIGMHILRCLETPGLGDKIFKDEDFVANFAVLAVDPTIAVVKDGRDAANEVDAITGATISSKAVVKIINAAHERWRDRLPEPGAVPPPPEAEAGKDGAP